MQVVYLPARVRRTCCFLDGAAAIQLGVACERIGLQHTNELGEMLLRMLTTSVGRIGKPDRWRFVGATRPIIARVDPETARFGAAVARRQYQQRCIVGVNLPAGQRIAAHGVDQRRKQAHDAAHPIPHCARVDLDAVGRIHDYLAVQRDVVSELRHGNVRKQRRARDAAVDRAARCCRLHDAIAARAGQLRTTVTDHAEVRQHVLELFCDVFAERLEPPTAIRTAVTGGQMDALFAFAMVRQRFPTDTFALRTRRCRSGGYIGGTFVGLQVFQPQFELFDLAIQVLRLPAELHAAQFRDCELQVLDLDRARRELPLQLSNLGVTLKQQRFQSVDVVRQRG
jgi:hypothetical protein